MIKVKKNVEEKEMDEMTESQKWDLKLALVVSGQGWGECAVLKMEAHMETGTTMGCAV